MPRYHIPDEPRPGVLAQVAVRPYWPLLASMLAGPWLGWPWLVLNGHAIGSTRRWRLVLVALAGFAGSFAILAGLGYAYSRGLLPDDTSRQLARLVLLVWKAAVAYALYVLQHADVELYEYYRGVVRNGLPFVIVGFIAAPPLLNALPALLRAVLR